MYIESTAELAATGEDKPETEKKEILVDEKAVLRVEEGEGEGSSVASDVTVHLEADVESLELLLCSDVGGVAEIKIRGESEINLLIIIFSTTILCRSCSISGYAE